MCDLVLAELQALADRPLLDAATRGRLQQVLRGPLAVWEERLERIRKTQLRFAELRAELDEPRAAAERPATPAPLPPTTGRTELPPAPRPGRTRRR